MMPRGHKVRPSIDAFEDKFIPEPNSGCWIWVNGEQGTYGKFALDIGDRKEFRAHRAAFLLYKGEIPNGLHVLHTCDMRECVNPDHLYVGTNRQNMDDRNKREALRIAAGLPGIVGYRNHRKRGK